MAMARAGSPRGRQILRQGAMSTRPRRPSGKRAGPQRAGSISPVPAPLARGGADRGPVTLEDVARVAGVHYSTVSRALDPAKAWRVGASTRLHVETVARELGYRRH